MLIHLLAPGRISYSEGLALQQRVVAARKAGTIGDTLLLLEHPPVLTLGRNSRREHVLASDELLAAKGVELHEINRITGRGSWLATQSSICGAICPARKGRIWGRWTSSGCSKRY
jgi:hypothetical protein